MALFQILRGKAANLAGKAFHDGYAYLTPDDGAFYIDAETDGEQKRIHINPNDYTVEQNNSLHQKVWRGTKAEYDAITTKDDDTLYIVTDDGMTIDPSDGNTPSGDYQPKITVNGVLVGDGTGNVKAATTETWTFTLADGSTVTKTIPVL